MPVVAVLAGGVVALIVLWALSPILRSVANNLAAALEWAPFGIANAIRNLPLGADAGSLSWARAAIAPLGYFLQRASDELRNLYNWAAGTLDAIPGALQRIIHYAQLLYNQAHAYSDQVLQVAVGRADDLYNLAVGYVNQAEAWTRNQAQALFAQAQAEAAALFAQASAELGAAEAATRALLQGGIDVLYRDLIGVRNEALAGIEAGVRIANAHADSLFGRAEQEIGATAEQARLEAEAARIRAEQYADAGLGAAAIAGAAALSQVVARVQAVEDSNCQQECMTLGGLGAELDLLEFGLILGLVTVIARDPKGAAGVIERSVAPGFREAFAQIRSLVA